MKMEETTETGNVSETQAEHVLKSKTKSALLSSTQNESSASPPTQGQRQHQPTKRRHRRGNTKAKNATKPYRKNNWKFQVPYLNYTNCANNGILVGGGGGARGGRNCGNVLPKPLVPYNTNKFLMEDHLAEISCAHWTPTGRTRDSSFSMDSEDNYFYSMPEDEEEFLAKEFSNVYEKARVERLENLSKSELIAECLQIEDRYSKDFSFMRQQHSNTQRNVMEYMSKIRSLENVIKSLSKENHNLRSQLLTKVSMMSVGCTSHPLSAVASTAASNTANCDSIRMDSSTEDSESDSSTSSSVSSSSSSPTSAASSLSHKSNDDENNVTMESKDEMRSPKSFIEPNNETEEMNHSYDQNDSTSATQNCESDSCNILESHDNSEPCDIYSDVVHRSPKLLHSTDAPYNSPTNQLPIMKSCDNIVNDNATTAVVVLP